MSRSSYSILVPFHSNLPLLRICLRTLFATVPERVEKIVILNNSRGEELPDDLAGPGLRTLREAATVGYPRAINLAASAARGRTLLFCDADTFYAGPWFEALTTFHSGLPNRGIAGSRILDPGTGRVTDFGIAFTRYNAPHPHMDLRADHPLVDAPRRVQATSSASMVIDAELFEAAGGMAEDLYSYADLDLCLRINEMGRECWVTNQSTVYHRGHSARDGHSAWKADAKALFATRNAFRIRPDMEDYFAASVDHFRRLNKLSSSYVLVDMTSVLDRDDYGAWFRARLPIAGEYDYSLGIRDAALISLVDHLGLPLLEHRAALLYFVDRFPSLATNRMWLSMRRNPGDLVVDRNGNMAFLSEVVDGRV